MGARDEHDELVRARDRLHKLEAFQIAAAARIRVVESRLDRIEPSVEALVKQEALAEAVAQKVEALKGQLFTTTQKVGAALVGSVVVADFLTRIFNV